jgi:hypothetical protein
MNEYENSVTVKFDIMQPVAEKKSGTACIPKNPGPVSKRARTNVQLITKECENRHMDIRRNGLTITWSPLLYHVQ